MNGELINQSTKDLNVSYFKLNFYDSKGLLLTTGKMGTTGLKISYKLILIFFKLTKRFRNFQVARVDLPLFSEILEKINNYTSYPFGRAVLRGTTMIPSTIFT